MAAPQPSLLPGQSPPLTIITATNKSGLVLIVTSLALAMALVSILIRAYVRHQFSPRQFAWDDAVIGIAMIFSIFQDTTVFVAVAKGFGKLLEHITSQHLIQLQKALYASDLLYVITLWLTKYSVAFLFLRLSPDRRHVRASQSVMIIAALTGITSVFIVALRCNLSHPWLDINTQCTGILTRWRVVFAFDLITECTLFAIAVYMVQGLQMSLYKKSVVIFAFGLRLPVIVAAAFRLHFIADTLDSADPTLTGVFANVCTQVQIMYAIVAATIPCLRPFMTATATNYGAPAPTLKTPGNTAYGRKTGSRGGTNNDTNNNGGFSLASLSRGVKSRLGGRMNSEKDGGSKGLQSSSSSNAHIAGGIYGGESFAQHDTNVGRGPRAASRTGSTESKQMIIRKDVEYAVEYDDPMMMGGAPMREGERERESEGSRETIGHAR